MAITNVRFWMDEERIDTRGVETRSQGHAAPEDTRLVSREARGCLTATGTDMERMADALRAGKPVCLSKPYFSRPFEFYVTEIHGMEVEIRCGQPVKDGYGPP